MNATRLNYLIGLVLVTGSFGFYLWEFGSGDLVLPRYLPVATTIGFLLMLFSFIKKRGILRGLGLAFALLIVAMSFMVVFGTTLPEYDGPGRVGQSIPVFAAKDSAGKEMTNVNLTDGKARVLIFYRGRW